jgi:hypothetical protein
MKAGISPWGALCVLESKPVQDRTAFACDASGVPTGTTCYTLANAVYFIHFHYLRSYQGASQDAPSTSIEVFRLAPVPSGYKARRKVYDDPIANRLAPPTPGESPEDAYEYDFWDYVISDRKDDWGLKPELIYSDPPSQPASK